MFCRTFRPASFLLLLTLFGLVSNPSAGLCQQRPPSDFNGDGFSELVLISLERTLVWDPTDPQSGSPVTQQRLGVSGDHVIMADWFGLGQPQIGVTRVERGSQFIVWRVRDQRGLIQELQFGDAGDTVVAGVDLDGTGAADAVIVRREGRAYRWFIQFDPFKGGSTIVEHRFATGGDSLFFLNPDGAGVRLAAQTTSKGSATLRLLNPLTGEVKVFRQLPTESKRGNALFSFPLKSPSGSDVAVSLRGGRDRTFISLLDPTKKPKRNAKPVTLLVKARGDTVYGNFLPNPGFEIGIKNAAGVLIVNPFDRTEVQVTTPSGVLVDELNVNRIGKKIETPQEKPQQPNQGDDAPIIPAPEPANPPSGGLASVCTTTTPVLPGEMLVKSEISKHIHGGDPRAMGYTVVCASQCPTGMNYVPFYFSDGTLAGAVGYYGVFNGNGRPRLYGAAADAPPHSVREIAPQAAARGNGKLYLAMGDGSCKEFGPMGRNGGL